MTKRQKKNEYQGKNALNLMRAIMNTHPVRYETLSDATNRVNPIHLGQAGYDDATYEMRFVGND